MFIELHMLQNFAPSNLNRDDTNNPKDCYFGGVRRARISSQCLKRSIRLHPRFAEVTKVAPSSRTLLVVRELTGKLTSAGLDEETAIENAIKFAANYSSKKAKMDAENPEKTAVLLYLSDRELEEIAQLILANNEQREIKKIVEDYAKKNNHPGAPDIAMFGRMLADRPETNVDAACQVAHAISTHGVEMEMDFFTAVDDLLKEEETGAGMMGITGYNSACFYRYASINIDQLKKNLNNDSDLVKKTVNAFIQSSFVAVPSGKQNSFAAQNMPSFALAVVREDGMCWSLANAFEKPVYKTSQNSLLEGSIAALDSYWGKMNRFFGTDPYTVAVRLDNDTPLEYLENSIVDNFDTFIESVIERIDME